MAKSVQFKTVDDVLTAYESRAVPRFAIFQDRQFLFKFEGESMDEGANYLAELLGILRNSAAIYTLAVYEDPREKINNKTPYDGSFNFRFAENTEGYTQGAGIIREMRDEIKLLTARVESLAVAGEDDEDEGPGQVAGMASLDTIGSYLSHPVVQTLLSNILPMFKNSSAAGSEPAAKIAGVDAPAAGLVDVQMSAELYQALTSMLAASAEAEKKLLHLGKVARENPGKFARSLSYVDLL